MDPSRRIVLRACLCVCVCVCVGPCRTSHAASDTSPVQPHEGGVLRSMRERDGGWSFEGLQRVRWRSRRMGKKKGGHSVWEMSNPSCAARLRLRLSCALSRLCV